MVEHQLPKLITRVRFPSPAPKGVSHYLWSGLAIYPGLGWPTRFFGVHAGSIVTLQSSVEYRFMMTSFFLLCAVLLLMLVLTQTTRELYSISETAPPPWHIEKQGDGRLHAIRCRRISS